MVAAGAAIAAAGAIEFWTVSEVIHSGGGREPITRLARGKSVSGARLVATFIARSVDVRWRECVAGRRPAVVDHAPHRLANFAFEGDATRARVVRALHGAIDGRQVFGPFHGRAAWGLVAGLAPVKRTAVECAARTAREAKIRGHSLYATILILNCDPYLRSLFGAVLNLQTPATRTGAGFDHAISGGRAIRGAHAHAHGKKRKGASAKPRDPSKRSRVRRLAIPAAGGVIDGPRRRSRPKLYIVFYGNSGPHILCFQ